MLFLDVFMTLSRKDLGKLYSLEASVVPAVVPGPCVVLAPDLAVVVPPEPCVVVSSPPVVVSGTVVAGSEESEAQSQALLPPDRSVGFPIRIA